MADIYVRSSGGNVSPFVSWANAATTLAGALAVATASDTIWVADDHAETQATAMTLTYPATQGLKILGVNTHTVTPPTAANLVAQGAWTATITLTSTTSINMANGFAYIYGIQFITGSGGGGNSSNIQIGVTGGSSGIAIDNCLLRLASTGSASMGLGQAAGSGDRDCVIVIKNSTFRFGATTQTIRVLVAHCRLSNCSIDAAGSAPTSLFSTVAACAGELQMQASDLSGKVWTNLVNVATASLFRFQFRDCKFPASFVATTGANPGPGGPIVEIYDCDSGNTNYRLSRNTYMGTTNNNNSIYRNGGATNGATNESFQMVSASGAPNYWLPLSSPEVFAYNGQTNVSLTATVDFLHDSLTALTDADIWLEILYLSDSGTPLGTVGSNAAATVITAGSPQPSSSATWTGSGGLTNPNLQKLQVTFTPQQTGYLVARVMIAKANYTVYVDPYIQGIAGTSRQVLLPYYGYVNLSAITSAYGSS